MNQFFKEIVVSTIGVFIGIFITMIGLTLLFYLFEEFLIGSDKTAAGGFFVFYILAIPIGGYLGNKYAMKWFMD